MTLRWVSCVMSWVMVKVWPVSPGDCRADRAMIATDVSTGCSRAAASGARLPAPKHQTVALRDFGRVGIALQVKGLELLDAGDLLFNGIARHQAAGSLGHEADDLVLAALEFLEHALHHRQLQGLAVNRLEILFTGQVDDQGLRMGLRPLIEVLSNARAPELVEVLALGIGQGRAHLEPVGLHPVQWPQHPVQAAEDAHMRLRPLQLCRLEAARIEAFVNIAIESQQSLPDLLMLDLKS